MISAAHRLVLGVLAILAWECFAGHSLLFGQDPTNQRKADELIRSGERLATIGYVLAGVGILVVLAAIPYGIYYDRKKKKKKK